MRTWVPKSLVTRSCRQAAESGCKPGSSTCRSSHLPAASPYTHVFSALLQRQSGTHPYPPSSVTLGPLPRASQVRGNSRSACPRMHPETGPRSGLQIRRAAARRPHWEALWSEQPGFPVPAPRSGGSQLWLHIQITRGDFKNTNERQGPTSRDTDLIGVGGPRQRVSLSSSAVPNCSQGCWYRLRDNSIPFFN